MKNWNLSMRDGSDSVSFDFETNLTSVLAEKINSFLNVCGHTTGEAQVSISEELRCIKEGISDKLTSVLNDGNDPKREQELEELFDAISQVISYVESEL
jgi:hypothetical protein